MERKSFVEVYCPTDKNYYFINMSSVAYIKYTYSSEGADEIAGMIKFNGGFVVSTDYEGLRRIEKEIKENVY